MRLLEAIGGLLLLGTAFGTFCNEIDNDGFIVGVCNAWLLDEPDHDMCWRSQSGPGGCGLCPADDELDECTSCDESYCNGGEYPRAWCYELDPQHNIIGNCSTGKEDEGYGRCWSSTWYGGGCGWCVHGPCSDCHGDFCNEPNYNPRHCYELDPQHNIIGECTTDVADGEQYGYCWKTDYGGGCGLCVSEPCNECVGGFCNDPSYAPRQCYELDHQHNIIGECSTAGNGHVSLYNMCWKSDNGGGCGLCTEEEMMFGGCFECHEDYCNEPYHPTPSGAMSVPYSSVLMLSAAILLAARA